MLSGRTAGSIGVCVVLALALAPVRAAQEQRQQSGTRADWPCGARIDSTYFQLAEATGGSMLLLAPSEMGDPASVKLMTTPDGYPQTILRSAGTINPGTHEFKVPIDPSVESVVFSIAVQCLQTADVIRPSGEIASGDGVTDLGNFIANRMVIVNRPAAGVWTIRVGGSGLAGVVVKARSALQTRVEFVPPGGSQPSPGPFAGVENTVLISIGGHPSRVEAAIVNGASKEIAALALTAVEDGVFTARFTPGADPFRVMIRGTDASGAPFQRVQAALHQAR